MKKRFIFIGLISAILLTGCNKGISLFYEPFKFSDVKETITKFDQENQYFYQYKDYKDITYYAPNGETRSDSYLSLMPNPSRMSSSGVDKILVIPISFTSKPNTLSQELKNKRIAIQNAFFGRKEHNSYYSVSEYYKRSSYGNLEITGFVSNWFYYDKYVPEKGGQVVSENILKEALLDILKDPDYYFFNNDLKEKDDNYSSINDFFRENSILVDGIFLVYDHPYTSMNKDDATFWAFTNSVEPRDSTIVTYKEDETIINKAQYGYYSWASYDFIHLKDNKSDAKTYIHEVGHLLGLADYYNNLGLYQPTGGLDMMDSNLGDEASFSKMLLNWTTPRVIKNNVSFDIDIKTFQDSGEVYLLPLNESYNYSPCDDYLLFEFFTPNILNNHIGEQYVVTHTDGKTHILNYPSTYGIKIYEIHAKLGYYALPREERYLRDIETNSVISNNVSINYHYYNNGISDSFRYETKPLIHLLEKNGNSFIDGGVGSNDTLFIVGDTFKYNSFSLSINRVTKESISVHFDNRKSI